MRRIAEKPFRLKPAARQITEIGFVGLCVERARNDIRLRADAFRNNGGDRHHAVCIRKLGERFVERQQALSSSLKDLGSALVVLCRRHRSSPIPTRPKGPMREIRGKFDRLC